MAAVTFIDDAVATTFDRTAPVSYKASAEKLSLEVADEAETTDVGHSSASEAESSSGASSHEGCRSLGRRCRFGKTSLETIPATPAASAMPMNSPPGLSRAAMRQARDACIQQEMKDAPNASSGMESRFGATPFGTVPKTPAGKAAKLKNLKSVFGSPPGLSHTEKRRERDACMTPAGWGNLDSLAGDLSGIAGKGLAQSKLAKMKARAALLKDLKDSQPPAKGEDVEQADDATMGDTSEPEATPEEAPAIAQNSRFLGTSLGTTPSTPARKEAAPASPPGLSSKLMRQSRDAMKATVPTATSWGTRKTEVLAISPSGKPLSPHAERAAKQRAARDAITLGWCASMPAMPQASGCPR